MERLLRIKFLIFLIIFSTASRYYCESENKNDFEVIFTKAIKNEIKCSNITVKTILDKDNANKIVSLAIKIEGGELDNIKADYITIQLDNPVFNIQSIKKSNRLRFSSYSNKKVNILLSLNTLQNYLQDRAKEFGKNSAEIRLKFTPPFVECFYSVPTKEVASETLGMISKFLSGEKLEGYAAFTFKVNKNELSAFSSKVILNHFLLPNTVLSLFEKKFNPFEKISPLSILDFKLNSLVVQSKYLLLSL